MKKQIGLIIGLIIILVLGVVIWQNKISAPTTNKINNQQQTINDKPVVSQITEQKITLADVAKHDNTSDCWTVVNDKVYNLTSWISQHPGGESAIINICGKDASSVFNKQHGSNERAQNALASFFLVDLSK